MENRDHYARQALTQYLKHSAAPASQKLQADQILLIETVLTGVFSQVHLSDKTLASRWDVSIELLQKLRREGRGPITLRLSAGIIRHSLTDVLAYEQASRRGVHE